MFNVGLDIPFSGLTIILLGDLYQSDSVQGKNFFVPFHNDLNTFSKAIYLFAENSLKDNFNYEKQMKLNYPLN